MDQNDIQCEMEILDAALADGNRIWEMITSRIRTLQKPKTIIVPFPGDDWVRERFLERQTPDWETTEFVYDFEVER